MTFTNSRVAGRASDDLIPLTCMLIAPQQTSLGGGLAARLPGGSGDILSTPDSVALSDPGDKDIRIRMAMDDFTPSAINTPAAKSQTAAKVSWYINIAATGRPAFIVSTDGTVEIASNGDGASALDGTNGEYLWFRVTLDADDGAGNHVVTFYNSTENTNDDTAVTWTQKGAAITTVGTVALDDNDSILEVGGLRGGTIQRFSGDVLRLLVYNGIDGTLAADCETNKYISGPTFVADPGEIWTLNGDVSIH